ncbi:MAG: restriction endonuclease subunit S [Fretibacterium sp.]|nr:restriction endonuclease subunit S [Fretibacterium sp.]
MTPKELKNSILQLAIQGRLVEQRPEDGTAEELYQRIQAEKAKRVREGKIRRERPLPEITEEEIPFEIPESWKWVRLGKIVSYSLGKTPTRSDPQWWASDIPWVSIADMPESGYITTTKERVSNSAISKFFGNKLSKAGTLLMSFKLTVGKVSILNIDAVHNEAIISIFPYPDGEKIIQLYFFQILPIITQYGDSKNAIKGRTLNSTSISNLLVPLPPLAEQKRIVAKIEELLPLVDRYEKAWTQLQDLDKRFPLDMKKSVLQLAIQGRLVEQRPEDGTAEELYQRIQAEKAKRVREGTIRRERPLPEITEEEIPFEIPESWKWVRIGNLGSYKKGPFGSTLTKSMFVPKGPNSVKVYEQKNAIQKDATLGEYYIRRDYFETKMSGFEVHPGDVIVSCAGTIGETYVLPDNIEQGIINQALMRMQVFEPMYVPYFLYYFDVVLKQSARAGSKGSAIKNIPPFEILKNYLIPLPPLAEQKRIAAKLDEIFSAMNLMNL